MNLRIECPKHFDGERFKEGGILIENGKFKETGEAYRIFSFGDCVILPGFIDVHSHLSQFGLGLLLPNLNKTTSLKDCLETVREAVKEMGGLYDFFVFEGFDESKWVERRLPTREELDKIESKKPLILRRVCGHIAVGNKKALERIPEGLYESQSGILFEKAALHVREYFPPSFEELKLSILRGQEEVLKLGITTIHEFGDGKLFRAYDELRRSGSLKLRVIFHFYEKWRRALGELGIRTSFGDDRLKIGGIKIFADGSIGAKTAAFKRPYQGKKGILLKKKSELVDVIRWGEERGVQVLIHAIGDRAIERVVQSFDEALLGGNPLRHRIEHFEFPDEAEMDLVGKLGILISMQPNFVVEWGMAGGMYERLLGERFRKNNPFKELLVRGIKVAFGSDSMPFGPLYGMRGALYHPVSEMRLNLVEALKLYTKNGAYFSFMEGKAGEIKEGYYADLVVYRSEEIESLHDRPLLVMVGGEVVYSREKLI